MAARARLGLRFTGFSVYGFQTLSRSLENEQSRFPCFRPALTVGVSHQGVDMLVNKGWEEKLHFAYLCLPILQDSRVL